ncbi:MAG: hypothetical protein ACXVAK_01600 [Vulcanimicrobiaceae bacterium]
MKRRLLLGLGIAAIVLSVATLAKGSVRAQSMFGGAPIDGIRCDSMEGAVEHIHAHLQIFNRGQEIEIPANVGIPLNDNCLYWLHTHAANGIIHIESPLKRTFTLGEFFDIWGPELSATQAAQAHAASGKRLQITVNGHPWHGSDPRHIVLQDRQEIVIQAGPPFAKPTKYDWSKL